MENADAALKSRARSASYSTSPLLRKWSFLDGVVVAKWWWSLPWEVLVVGVIKKDWHVLGRMRCRRDSFAIDWNMFLVVLLDWCLTAGQVRWGGEVGGLDWRKFEHPDLQIDVYST